MKVINKCLFPVAGRGTRFLPITKAIPKELLPVVDKPLLQFGVEEAYNARISDMVMVISDEKRAIEQYFTADHGLYSQKQQLALSKLKTLMDYCQFSFPRQQQMLGLGHAISCGAEAIGKDDFAVLLPDDLCNINTLSTMIKLQQKYQCCVIAVEPVNAADLHRYGIIKAKAKPLEAGVLQVTDMVEKPKPEEAPSNYGVIGRYILSNDVLAILATTKPGINGEIQLTDALKIKAQQGNMIAYVLPHKRFDCGTASGLVNAINAYSDIDYALRNS